MRQIRMSGSTRGGEALPRRLLYWLIKYVGRREFSPEKTDKKAADYADLADFNPFNPRNPWLIKHVGRREFNP